MHPQLQELQVWIIVDLQQFRIKFIKIIFA